MKAWAGVVGALALLVRLPFLFGRHEPEPGGDSEHYFFLADHLFAGHGIVGSFFHLPGYPAFLAFGDLAPGREEDVANLMQHLLGVALAVAILGVAWKFFGRATAVLAAGLAALTPALPVLEHSLLPDFLFGVLVFAGAAVLAWAVRAQEPSTRLLVAAGVLFGIATWVKPVGQFLLLAPPLALLFATRRIAPTLRGSAIAAAALVVVISPWLVRNAIDHGSPRMTVQGGATLFNRVFEVDGTDIPTDAEWGSLAAEVRARLAGDPESTDAPFGLPRLHYDFHEVLVVEHGLGDSEAWDVEQRLALTAIRRHPFGYARRSAALLGDSVDHLDDFEGSDELRDELDRTDPPTGAWPAAAGWTVGRALFSGWWLISLHGAAGLLALFAWDRAGRNAAAALLSVWLAVMLGTVLGHGGQWRYSMQLAPITFILGSAGAVVIVSAVWDALRRTPP